MTKRTLAARSPGAATSCSWASTSTSSKMLPERGGDLLAGALDVRGDRRRARPRPRPGSARRTACAAPRRPAGWRGRSPPPREPCAPTSPENFVVMRSSATISEREHVEDEVAVGARHPRPLAAVGLEVDRERRPLRVLPAPVERLGVVELDLVRRRHAGLLARMIADDACACTRWVSRISMSTRPALASARLELLARQRAGDAARPCLHVARVSPRPCPRRRSRRRRRSARRAAAPARPRAAPAACRRRG